MYAFTHWEFDKGQIPCFQAELRELYSGKAEGVDLWNDCGKRIQISGKCPYEVSFDDTFDPANEDSCLKFHFQMDQSNIQELMESLHSFVAEYNKML